ncbi:hypothetical protein PHJA_002895800, partial [Phtheirospermum japonicum]
NKWERQDSNLRRKTSTDLQSVAFDHSATLPFPGRIRMCLSLVPGVYSEVLYESA